MEELISSIDKIFAHNPVRLTVSKPRKKEQAPKKLSVRKLGTGYQVTRIVKNQSLHANYTQEEIKAFLITQLQAHFMQLQAVGENKELELLLSKKGKVTLLQRSLKEETERVNTHNRQKQYLLQEGMYIAPLVDMGIFTKEGRVVVSMYDKFKQINRFIETVDDVIPKDCTSLSVLDFGCGKGYLTFLLYHYLVNVRNIQATVVGVDLKEAVMEDCNRVAKKYGYDGLSFYCGNIETYQPQGGIDMVVTLHACDTATDFALYHAIRWNAGMIFSMPCCQHELNGQLSSEEFPIFQRYGVIKERVAAEMTDAIRGNLLMYCGYKVQLLDIVNPVHTAKNLMIRAVRKNITQKQREDALREVQTLTETFHLAPTLCKLLNLNETSNLK